MSNSWIPNTGDESSQRDEDFDLFAPPAEDNLQEVLARGSYKWTNKYTALLGILALLVTSGSAGIWYGHRTSISSGISNASAFNRGGFSNRSGNNAALSGANNSALGSSGNLSGGFGGAGGPGGRGTSATVTSVKGNSITVTTDSTPTVKAGDSVTLRTSGGANSNGNSPTANQSSRTSSSAGSRTQSTTTPKSGATPAPSISAGGRQGGRGGFQSSPEFIACMKKEGVTVSADTPPDRNDPKVLSALQSCRDTLGFGGGGGGSRPAPNGSSTAKP